MKRFQNAAFIGAQSLFSYLHGQVVKLDEPVLDALAPREVLDPLAALLRLVMREMLSDIEIPLTKLAVERFCLEFENPEASLKIRDVWSRWEEVNSRLFDEFESHGKFFYIPQARADLFETQEPFGPVISRKFPKLIEDAQEAAKCYACARYTACVFHLMRVMEYGVQRLGKKLKVEIDVENENWQNILNSITKEIKLMDAKKQRTKLYAEIANHLYNVKVAWRNTVMHPKATYTEEEAENLLAQVGAFMRSLARAV